MVYKYYYLMTCGINIPLYDEQTEKELKAYNGEICFYFIKSKTKLTKERLKENWCLLTYTEINKNIIKTITKKSFVSDEDCGETYKILPIYHEV